MHATLSGPHHGPRSRYPRRRRARVRAVGLSLTSSARGRLLAAGATKGVSGVVEAVHSRVP